MLSPTAGQASGVAGRWLEALPHPVVALDLQGRVLAVNAAGAALVGVSEHDIVGRVFCTVAMTDAGCGGFHEVLELVGSGVHWTGELHLRPAAAAPVVQVRHERVLDGTTVSGSLLTVDVVGSRREHALHQSERLNKLARVAAELQTAETPDKLTDVVVSHFADAAGATTASLSEVLEDGVLGIMGIRGGTEAATTQWAHYPVDRTTPAGEAVLTGKPLVLSGREAISSRYPTLRLAAEGERSMLCLPLMMAGRAVGVATLSFPHPVDFDDSELEFYRIMADSCAQALERIRAVQKVAEQHEKLRFLAEASAELARSLDYES